MSNFGNFSGIRFLIPFSSYVTYSGCDNICKTVWLLYVVISKLAPFSNKYLNILKYFFLIQINNGVNKNLSELLILAPLSIKNFIHLNNSNSSIVVFVSNNTCIIV